MNGRGASGQGTKYHEEILAGLISGSMKGVRVPMDQPSEANAESIIRNMPNAPSIGFGRLRSYDGSYYSESDEVWVHPKLEGAWLRYPTIFHELAHATGHSTRLNRETITAKRRSRASMCREEILAELSALLLCLEVGLFWSYQSFSAEYIKSFLEPLNATTPETRAAVLRPLHAEAIAVVSFILGSGVEQKAAA